MTQPPEARSQAAAVTVEDAPANNRKRRSRRRFWLALLFCVLALFYGTVGYLGSGLMISDTPRWRGMNRGPQDFGLQGETVSFEAADGVPIKAWWLPAQSPARGTVILAPGGDHTRQVMLPRAAFLVHNGYSVVDRDLRGHGESGGVVISTGQLERNDVLGAIRYVRSRGDRGPIVLMGVCLGGVASLYAAAESRDVAAVISDSAFPSGKDVFQRIRGYFVRGGGQTGLANGRGLGVRALFAAAYLPGIVPSIVITYYLRTGVWLGFEFGSVLPSASRIQCPVLIISGEADWIVPPADARKIFSAIPGDRKQLITIPKAGHDSTHATAPDLYQNAVLRFLDGALKQ